MNPLCESDVSETAFSMASTVVMSSHVRTIQSADHVESECPEGDRDILRDSFVSTANTVRQSTSISGDQRVEMTDEEMEKVFVSTDLA